ncbi:MAG: hypothetical protein JWP06_727 [Candidatus Saccharibacteria bacterium]|nr:hypothetical protein [Candidatus Saccharibacteria bacterium]
MDMKVILQEFVDGELIELDYASPFDPFGVSEYEFMRYALTDLDGAKERKADNLGSLGNAVTNAKRAMHCRIDRIFSFWGLAAVARSKRWDFPRKLDKLGEGGVVTPSLLRRLNAYRNKAEHEYEKPDMESVEDFVDTVLLFLEASEKYLQMEISGISETGASREIGNQESIEGRVIDRPPSPWLGAAREWVKLKVEREKAEIAIDYCLPGKDGRVEKAEIVIKAVDSLDDYLLALNAWNIALLYDSYPGLLRLRYRHLASE